MSFPTWTIRRAAAIAAVLMATAGAIRAQTLTARHTWLALTGLTVIDGTGGAPRSNTTILIDGDRIAGVFPSGSRTLSAETKVLNLAGRFAIPGLIDSHVHLATDPTGEDSRVRTERRLRKALLGGITTVRDMAGDVRSLGALQRDALLGTIPSPDIYYAALFAGPRFFADPRTHDATRGLTAGQVPWMRAISDTTDIRQAVAEARGTGATAIKLYADLNRHAVEQIAAEAHRQELKVWAHADLDYAKPIDVVTGGVDAISHAPLLARAMDSTRWQRALHVPKDQPLDVDDAGLDTLFREMIRRGTVFEPTLFVYADLPARYRLGGAITKRAHDQGVTIIAGTDTLGDANTAGLALPNLHEELALLVTLGGLSASEAIQSATRNAAGVLGAQDSLGTIAVGKLANIVVLGANPLTDIRNTRSVQLVIKRGHVYARRQGQM